MQATREQTVEIARSWLGTPYVSQGLVRGRRGGTDCAMLLVGVYREAGWIPETFDPRPYSPQWHVHRRMEKYRNFVREFADQVPESEVRPADVVIFKIGNVYAHGGIVEIWPRCICARAYSPISYEDVMRDNLGRHALARAEKEFYTVRGVS